MTRVLWGLGLFMATISVLAYTGTIPVALVQVHGLDKIGHFLLFGSFAAVGVACAQLRAGPGRDVKSIAWVTLVCVLAGIDEAAQQLSPFR